MAPQQQIVVLGEDDDIHIELVREHLDQPPLVLNVGRLEEGFAIEFTGDDTEPTVTFAGQQVNIGRGHVKSVWYRKTNIRKMRPDLKVSPPEEFDYAISSLTHLHQALAMIIDPGAFWVSNRYAIVRAELKPLQLITAREAGFEHIPPTLFTSNPQAAAAFVKRTGDSIVKSMSWIMPSGLDQYTVVGNDTSLDFRGLEFTPHVFQKPIVPELELRVAVVENDAFASAVSDSDAASAELIGMRDYRCGFNKGTFVAQPFELPPAIAAACVLLVRKLGLVTGFIDLIRDRYGRYWFLEINPNGEWAFMDEITVQKIARCIAALLVRGRAA